MRDDLAPTNMGAEWVVALLLRMTAHGGLTFEPPVLLGPCDSFGVQAALPLGRGGTSGKSSAPAMAALLRPGTAVVSTDGGRTFATHESGPLPEFPPVSVKDGSSWHDFGNVSHSEPKTTRPTYFNFSTRGVNRFHWRGGQLSWSQDRQPLVFFGGLPFGAGDELYTRSPLRLQGGGQVVLKDGSILHSGSVWWPECQPACMPVPNQTDALATRKKVRSAATAAYSVLRDTQLGQHYLSHSNMTVAVAEAKCSAEPMCTGFCFRTPEQPQHQAIEIFLKHSHGTFNSTGWTTYLKNNTPSPAPPPPPHGAKTNCCPGNAASNHGTSSIAFRSTDGYRWEYLSTIMDARSIPGSEEGCSEHDLVRLQSGEILMICRTDAGDGEETHKSSNYARVVSSDEGRTWSYPEYVNAGSARPRLLATTAAVASTLAARANGTDRAGGSSRVDEGKEVLIMSGGRWGTAGSGYGHNPPAVPPGGRPVDWRTANRSMEPTIFLDDSGSKGLRWTAHSVSFWHNHLA